MIKRVLFVCTGNTCRSSMAEALLRKMLREDLGEKATTIQVVSAGTGATSGENATQNAITVMKQEGIDISAHRSKRLTPDLVNAADLVLTMTLEQKEAVVEMAPAVQHKVFTLAEFAEGVKELETLLDQAEKQRVVLEEKRHRVLEQAGPKFEELHHRYHDLNRQMRSLEEELRQIEVKIEQEMANEKRSLEELQVKLTSLEIADPYGQNIDAYNVCAMQIKEKLKSVVTRIKESLEE